MPACHLATPPASETGQIATLPTPPASTQAPAPPPPHRHQKRVVGGDAFSPSRSGVDSSWLALFAPAPAWIFPNLLVWNYLIDCIALASFTHSHALVHQTVHSFSTKNR